MGYIPLVRDEQSMLYGNRQLSDSPMITEVPPVQRAEFFEALKDQAKQKMYLDPHTKYCSLAETVKFHEKKITGKGKFFDESI
ncbi:hypothetical protein [Evansella halocellulosilytica]|uniref:hypothetical protein n=1 Tax=Evansella halocellulosilytica TaxID=2011013 RepID=UPI000BB801B1|nr:hypothetical protein [Evansella halocellulosilytica]